MPRPAGIQLSWCKSIREGLWRPEDDLQGLVLSFHYVSPEDQNLDRQTSQQTHLPQRSLTSLLTILFPP